MEDSKYKRAVISKNNGSFLLRVLDKDCKDPEFNLPTFFKALELASTLVHSYEINFTEFREYGTNFRIITPSTEAQKQILNENEIRERVEKIKKKINKEFKKYRDGVLSEFKDLVARRVANIDEYAIDTRNNPDLSYLAACRDALKILETAEDLVIVESL